MSFLQWSKYWQRKSVAPRAYQRPQQRSFRPTCEPLEDRRMLTLLGVAPVNPQMTYDSTGHIQYTASADTFDLTAQPLSFKDISGPPHNITAPRGMDIHVLIDSSGNLISGVAGDDFSVSGTVTPDGNPLHTVSGVLLTGEVLGFGFLEVGVTDQYDFRFVPTGGLLASYWAGHDIGVTVSSENSTFANDFTSDFSGGAKGNIGNITSLPGHIIVDKITDPSGDPTSFSFNTTGTGYSAFGLTDTDAPNDQQVTPGTYSVSEMVPADWDLTGLSIVDPTGNSTSSGGTATLNVGSGETIHVTYTDTKRGHIIVDKITDPSGDPTSFSFNTTGTGYAAFGLTDNDAPNDQSLAPGSYSVAELVPAGWDLTGLSIVDPTGDSTSVGSTATLSLAAGETIHVTYTDTVRGRIIVDKITDPGGDPTSFSFTASGAGYSSFGLTDADAPNDQQLVPGSYSIAELVPADWDLTNLSIVDPTGDSTSAARPRRSPWLPVKRSMSRSPIPSAATSLSTRSLIPAATRQALASPQPAQDIRASA